MRYDAEGRYFPDHYALEKIVLATFAALVAKYPERVDTARVIYAGYSQGGTMGALAIAPHADVFSRLVLVEGGFDAWTLDRATHFHDLGGERVLMLCGRERCRSAAEQSAAVLRRAGVEARVESRVGAGHTYAGAVGEALVASFGWVTDHDPRWEAR
jgi:pimeloyl-ACP methyl ester carboxylesterase